MGASESAGTEQEKFETVMLGEKWLKWLRCDAVEFERSLSTNGPFCVLVPYDDVDSV